MLTFATSRIVHATLNKQLGPWFRSSGWRRRKGGTCAFYWFDQPATQYWLFWIQCSSRGDKAYGNRFTANLPKVQDPQSGYWSDRFLYQVLTDADFAEALAIETRIAERLYEHVDEAEFTQRWKDVGILERAQLQQKCRIYFTAHPDYWVKNRDIWFPYYSRQDVEDWGAFILARLPRLVARCYSHAA